MSLAPRAAGEDADLSPLKLEDRPTYRDEWTRQHPALSLLYHHDVITHLVWCAVACRYLTGGADGEVKIWKSEPSHTHSASAPFSKAAVGGPVRPWLLPERHIVTLGGPVTGVCVTDREAGSSEVAVVAATDGTLTLCRTNTGEIVRTLRGARGESIESFRATAVRAPKPNAPELDTAEFMKGHTARSTAGPPEGYSADAVSRRLAPMSDLAIVRRPVYTIRAYRDEVRDVFAGPSNGFFHGLRSVAPTYAHLAPQEETVADVLAAFGVAAATSAPRQWYASAVTLAVAPDMRAGSNTVAAADGAPTRDLYLLLGFPEGLLQVYVLPQRWFQLHLHGETRLDPPSLRFPILSTPVHAAAVLRIDVLHSRDLVVSVSEDGTAQLRRFSALQAPLRQLGECVVPSSPVSAIPPTTSPFPSTFAAHVQATSNVGASEGHTRCVTCCCVDVPHQLLITGSADHTLRWWSLMAGSPSTPVRVLSLRDASSNVLDAAAAPASDASVMYGGYPIDISFFSRPRGRRAEDAVDGGRGGGTAGDAVTVLCLLVLDTEQVVRVFDALSGKLLLEQATPKSAAAVATATAPASTTGDARVRRNVRLVRYDNANGADRLLLGGLSLVPWYLTTVSESNAVDGHTEPILFLTWCATLRCVITADAHHILLWRNATVARSTTPHEENRPVAEVLRAWKLPLGIRSVTLCEDASQCTPGAASPSLLVVVREQQLLIQYDCLAENPFPTSTSTSEAGGVVQMREPLRLRQFVLRMESGGADVASYSVTSLAAVFASTSRGRAHVEAVDGTTWAYVIAVYQRDEPPRGVRIGGSDQGSRQGGVLIYSLRDAAADGNSADVTFPSREVRTAPHGRGRTRAAGDGEGSDEVVSALAVPASGLLVLGGRRVLYVTSLFGTAASATPCTALPAVPATSRRRRNGGTAPPAASHCTAAVFPGPLMGGDDGGDDSNAADVLTTATVASPEGYLSRLVVIDGGSAPQPGTPCFVLSGSNGGIVQLWDVVGGAELWRCSVSLSQEPVTALSVRRCANRWLVAVGDQTGVVTVLDVTAVIVRAYSQYADGVAGVEQQRCSSAAAPSAARPSSTAEAFMVDRWQAHTNGVSGVCFTEAEAEAKTAAAPQSVEGQTLLTTGEDAAVEVWWLPLLLPSRLFCSVKTGERLFERRAAYPLQPRLTRLPWPTRDVYAKFQEWYVRHTLFERHQELMAAFTTLYTQSTGTTTGTADEDALLDRAWQVLVADTHSLLTATRDTSQPFLAPLSEAVVRDWCVSLTAAPSPVSVSASTSVPPATHVLAFADRCCGANPRRLQGDAPHQSAPSNHREESSSSSSPSVAAVRRCLRGAVRAVVQATSAQRARRSPTSPPPGQQPAVEPPSEVDATHPPSVARPATELFSAVATIAALTHSSVPGSTTEPPVPLTTGAAATSSSLPVPPAVNSDSGAGQLGSLPHTNPTPATTRRVLFDEEQRTTSGKAAPAATSSPDTSVATRGYRVAYGLSTPLVRGTSGGAASHTEVQQHRHITESPAPGDTATAAADLPFSEGLAEESSSADGGESDGSDADRIRGRVRAAAVVERVHRNRRLRGDALQSLVANGHDDENAELFSQARSAARENRRLTRESISRYVVMKDGCRALVEDEPPHAAARECRAARDSNASGTGSTKAVTTAAPLSPADPVVADTYLAAALARVNVDVRRLGGGGGGVRDRLSASLTSQLSWYAMRQRRRDVAQENARLWNTPRVMQSLMRWSSTPPQVDALEINSGNGDDAAAGGGAVVGTGCATLPPPQLTLPHILAARSANSPQRQHCDSTESLCRPDLPTLLHAPPTAAIDAAVHPGLPTRATLQREAAAMQARMRQSVQQRAAQQRRQHILAAAVMESVAAPKNALVDDAGDNGENDSDQRDDLDSDTRESPLLSPELVAVTAPTSEQTASERTQLSVSATTTSLQPHHRFVLAKPRSAVPSGDGTDTRRMATVPLPNATTRRELFAHRAGGAGKK